jgi:hypothetical protein
MQGTADFHDQIADARLSQAAGVVDDATALDTAVDVLDAHAPTGDASIGGFLAAREGSATGLAGRHEDLDLVERECQEAQILEQATARGSGIGGSLSHSLVVGTPRISLTQEEDGEHGVDQQHVFDGVALFLAALIARLLSRILGTPDAPFSAIVPKRGEAGAGAGGAAGGSAGVGSAGVGTTIALTSASATPKRWANACTERLGASPRLHSVARRTTKRT